MASTDLHSAVAVKTMASDIARRTQPEPEEGIVMAAAYQRLRNNARALNGRAWPDDETFDAQIPVLDLGPDLTRDTRDLLTPVSRVHAEARGLRAAVLAGQLAAWAEGHQQAFEIEARLEADATAKAKQAKAEADAAKSPLGFTKPDG